MLRSTERILTTHAGRLPNPNNIAAIQHTRANGDQATWDQLVTAGIAEMVRKQMELRNDIHSDGAVPKQFHRQEADSQDLLGRGQLFGQQVAAHQSGEPDSPRVDHPL